MLTLTKENEHVRFLVWFNEIQELTPKSTYAILFSGKFLHCLWYTNRKNPIWKKYISFYASYYKHHLTWTLVLKGNKMFWRKHNNWCQREHSSTIIDMFCLLWDWRFDPPPHKCCTKEKRNILTDSCKILSCKRYNSYVPKCSVQFQPTRKRKWNTPRKKKRKKKESAWLVSFAHPNTFSYLRTALNWALWLLGNQNQLLFHFFPLSSLLLGFGF